MRTAVQRADTKSSADSSSKSQSDQTAGLGLDPPGELLDLQRIIRGEGASGPKNGPPDDPAKGASTAASGALGGAAREPQAVQFELDAMFGSRPLGAPGPLPFESKMEAGFGRSLRDVQAYTGPEAKAAANSVGAEAFTVGQKVVFADSNPPEHVVAHEVAHTVQQSNSGAPANRAQLYGGPTADALEREANLAAQIVVDGGHAQVTGKAGGSPVQPFDPIAYAEAQAAAAKKKVVDEVKKRTGYDATTNTYEADIPLTDAIEIISAAIPDKWKPDLLDRIMLDKANSIHVKVDFNAETADIRAGTFHAFGIANKGSGFWCGDIELKEVHIFVTRKPLTVLLEIGKTHVQNAHFKEWKLGYPTVRELKCAELKLPIIKVDAEKVHAAYGWILDIDLHGANLQGLEYPGLPPADIEISSKATFKLDQIGSALAPPSDSGLLPVEVPSVLPKDGRIDVELKGLDGAFSTGDASRSGPSGGVAFDLFSAEAFARDGSELASVTIEGFKGRGSTPSEAASGHINKLAVKGAPATIKALLYSEPVYPKVADALAIMKSAGIEPDIGTNLTLKDVDLKAQGGVPKKDGAEVKARASLAVTLDVPDIGTLDVRLDDFVANYETSGGPGTLDASFSNFIAKLTGKGKDAKELAYVALSGASGYVNIDGGAVGGGGKTQFVVRGDLAGMIKALQTQLKQLPRPVLKILPVVQQLGVKGEVGGSVSLNAQKGGAFVVGGNLDLTLKAASADSQVKLALTGFQAESMGPITGAAFSSFRATFLVKGKEAASVFAEGAYFEDKPKEEKKDGEDKGAESKDGADKDKEKDKAKDKDRAGDTLIIPKLVVTGDGSEIAALAGSLASHTSSLPPKVQRICALVAKNVLVANGWVQLNNVKAGLDPEGNQSLRADLKGAVVVSGVGLLEITVKNFREQANVDKGALGRVGFDRIEMTLYSPPPAKTFIASFAADADYAGASQAKGKDYAFKAGKIEAHGQAKGIESMLAGASANIKFLPENVQLALKELGSLGVNGKGDVTITGVEISGDKAGTQVKGELTSSFDVPGVGTIKVVIKGFEGKESKTESIVRFKSFEATLTATKASGTQTAPKPKSPDGDAKPDDGQKATFAVTMKDATPAPTGSSSTPAAPKATVQMDGDAANRKALLEAIEKNVQALPDQVKAAIDLSLESIKNGTALKADAQDIELGKRDGHVVARGQISVEVDVPNVGKVKLKLIGKEAKDGTKDVDDPNGFESLTLQVFDAENQEAASLTVLKGEIRKGKSLFEADSLTIKGDVARIHKLFTSEALKFFPTSIAPKLAMLDKTNLTEASATKLKVTQDGAGKLKTEAKTLELKGDVYFVDKGMRVSAPGMQLVFNTATLQLDGKNSLESIGAASLHGTGTFHYQEGNQTMDGTVTLDTKQLTAGFSQGPVKVTANGLSATGNITRKVTEDKPATPEEKAKLNRTIKSAAGLVKSASIGLTTPLNPDRYGGTFAHITVNPKTQMVIELWVENNVITTAKTTILPPMEFDGVDINGIGLDKDGVVKTDTNWFADWLASLVLPSILKDKLGQETVPLDLKQLAKVVTTRFMNPTAKEEKKEEKKPGQKELADFASKGFDVDNAVGSVYLEVAAPLDTSVAGVPVSAGSSITFTGELKKGGSLVLHASGQVGTKLGGQKIEATGIKGPIDASLDFRTITFKEFGIEKLYVNGGVNDAPTEKTTDDKKPEEKKADDKKPEEKKADGAVQKKASPGAGEIGDPGEVRRLAAQGIASGGSALPHGDLIQRAFGRHDISNVQSHVGGEAAQASRAIGAKAYTSGDHVAFASAPDVRLAAHEAAHVVQQKGGIQLAGGVGREGDGYEQHADAVAEAVVSGRSAEHLLDPFASSRGAPSGPVQRKDDKQPWSLDPSLGAPKPMYGDPRAFGIDVNKPLPFGAASAVGALDASEDLAVREWMAEHRAEIVITARMPDLIRRVRLEVGQKKSSLVTATDQRILDLIHGGAAALGLPLPKDELPAARSEAEVRAAAAQGLSGSYGFSITSAGGQLNVVAFGKTPDIAREGVQIKADIDGVTYTAKDAASKNTTSLQLTTDLGFKFSTNIGPLAFTAGIDPNQWQIGISFGPDVPDLASLPAIFSNAHHALGAAARALSTGGKGNPKDLYDTAVSPHLPALKAALAAAKAAAAVKPGKVSIGVKATGPGYEPYAAEGAVKGITVMATFSVTF